MKIINSTVDTTVLFREIRSQRLLAQQHNTATNVSEIIAAVKKEGDCAVRRFTQKFDKVVLKEFKVQSKKTTTPIKAAIDRAYQRIERFHKLQIPQKRYCNEDGIKAWKSWVPIEKVGLYVPGGTAPLISSLLMMAIPAKIAGCSNIVCATPPTKTGDIDPAFLYTAKLCGINNVFAMGGAQAIAALAFGTETVPKVDKIFGPGNKYVNEAKIQVSNDPLGASFDLPAGPSEVLIIADENANAEIIASDLLAQAEHDPDAVSICVTPCPSLAQRIQIAVDQQRSDLKRKSILNKAIKNSFIAVTANLEDAFVAANTYAPEHLIINTTDPNRFIDRIKNAGSVFLGPWSAEAIGDYASGPNHVLPTNGNAKKYSGLSVESFMKSITFQEVSPQGLIDIAETVETLAKFEGLDAHRTSVTKRKKLLEKKR